MRIRDAQEERIIRGFLEVLERAEWLVNKGADIYRKHGTSLALHFLVSELGSELSSEIYLLSSLEEQQKAFFYKSIFDPVRDLCRCACSVGGCNGFLKFVHGYFSGYNSRETRNRNHFSTRELAEFAYFLDLPSEEEGCKTLIASLLRLITFNKLELSHTCVCYTLVEPITAQTAKSREQAGPDPVELQHIREESYDQILQLEELVLEFVSVFEERAEPLSNFIKGYWANRMSEVLDHSETPTQAYIESLRTIGVVLHEY